MSGGACDFVYEFRDLLLPLTPKLRLLKMVG